MAKDFRKDISRRWIQCVDLLHSAGDFASFKDFKAQTGIAEQSVTDIRAGRKDATLEMIVSTRNVYGISSDYVLYGEGPSLLALSNPTLAYKMLASSPYVRKMSEEIKDRLVFVDQKENTVAPIINYKALASYSGYDSQEKLEHADTISLPSLLVRGGEHMVFPVKGDSMEPTFLDRDYVLCRRVSRNEWRDIKKYTVCVVYSTTHGLQLKRLRYIEHLEQLRCKSDNRTHRTVDLNVTDVQEVWRFEWRLTSAVQDVTENVFRRVDNVEDALEDVRRILENLVDEKELKRLQDLRNPKKEE